MFKIFFGKIINISSAISNLYCIEYFSEKNILESDWLYCNRELKIGEEVRIHDGEEKFIMEKEDVKKHEKSTYSDK